MRNRAESPPDEIQPSRPRAMERDDLELFREAVSDSRPLETDKLPLPRPGRPTPGELYRREAAARRLDDETFLPLTFIEPVAPEEVVGFRREGVQFGVYRRLRRGEYPIGAVLDLHGMTVKQARRAVYRFILDCQLREVRTALIIHGKGEKGLLKGCLVKWLPHLPEVLAFHTAVPRDGGTGAIYLLLKKVSRAKERNRRRFQMGEL